MLEEKKVFITWLAGSCFLVDSCNSIQNCIKICYPNSTVGFCFHFFCHNSICNNIISREVNRFGFPFEKRLAYFLVNWLSKSISLLFGTFQGLFFVTSTRGSIAELHLGNSFDHPFKHFPKEKNNIFVLLCLNY